MHSPSKQTCLACGSEVVSIEHQTRAADEPQTVIRTCSRCPLDASKMRLATSPPRLPVRYAVQHRRQLSDQLNISAIRSSRCDVIEIELREGVPAELTGQEMPHLITACSIPPTPPSCVPARLEYHHTGLYAKKAVRKESEKDLGLGFRTARYVATEYSDEPRSGRLVKLGGCWQVFIHENVTSWVYSMNHGNGTRYLLSVRAVGVPERHCLSLILSVSMCHKSIYSVLDKGEVRSLRNAASRAWDAPIREYANHVYTTKVDGERSWCVVDGYIAMHFKCGGERLSWGYNILEIPHVCSKPVVIDTEYCGPYGVVFIDMLTDLHGGVAPASRSIRDSLRTAKKLGTQRLGIPLRIREYFNSLEEAISYTNSSSIPNDGILAIEKAGVSAKKLKPFRSVELRIDDDMNLRTEDGVLAIEGVNLEKHLAPGEIVEVRFRASVKKGKIAVLEIFGRPDKTTANMSTAFVSILECSGALQQSSDIDRRTALLWCNTLRSRLVSESVKEDPNKSIIINVGAGSGQAIDELGTYDTVSFLHIEPDEVKCSSLCSRLGIKGYTKDTRQILSSLRSLKTRSTRSVVLCCSIEDVLEDEEVCNYLMPEVRSVLATFSAHFCADALKYISDWGVPVYGCFYTYDGVDLGECAVDSCGVTMKRVTESECAVKWGGDKEYREPYVTSVDFSHFLRVAPAREVVHECTQFLDSEAYKVFSRVLYLRPK